MTQAKIFLICMCALGVWLIVQRVPTATPPALRERVDPYLRGSVAPWAVPQVSVPTRWMSAWSSSGVSAVGRWLAVFTGGDRTVIRRLDALGQGDAVDQFRLEQLGWGVGSAAGLGVLLVGRGVSADDWFIAVVLILLAAMAGILARDQALSRAVQRRTERLRAELPTVVEMLAMAVGAGASLTAALERVHEVGHGVVASELARVLDDTRVGLPLVPALQRMASRNELNEVSRFVESVVVALERGTPLADVLAAQAGDAREAGRRALIEAGGRKEIGMMFPIVFLVLPLSVLFVLFPGFYGLSLGS